MLLIVLANGEVDCVETDGVNNNRVLVVKHDPPIYDDIECLESREPGAMNPKRKAFYRKLWAKNFSRIIRAEKQKAQPDALQEFDLEIEVTGGVADITKKRQGITARLRDYDNENSDTGEKYSETIYDEEEEINNKL